MLTLYKTLENQVVSTDDKNSGAEKAKCVEIAANIAIGVLKLESEGIKAIHDIITNYNNTNKGQRCLNNLQSKNDESTNIQKEYDPNRKF